MRMQPKSVAFIFAMRRKTQFFRLFSFIFFERLGASRDQNLFKQQFL